MYVKNPETIPKERLYSCRKSIADWLIYKKNFALFAKEENLWYFANTNELKQALKEIPFWLNVFSKF